MRRLMGLAWDEPSFSITCATCCVVVDERRQGLAHGQQWLDHAHDHHIEMASELGLSDEERSQLWPCPSGDRRNPSSSRDI